MNGSRLDTAIDLLGLAAVVVGAALAGMVAHAYRKVRP